MSTLRELLDHHDDRQQEGRDLGLGPSDIGGCERRQAYRLHQVPPTDPDVRDAAIVGTMLHEAYAARVDALNDEGRLTEVQVVIPHLSRTGRADDVDFNRNVVTDLKTVGRFKFDSWLNSGPPEQVWQQTDLYALGLRDDSRSQGAPWALRIAALCRDTGRTHEWERVATPETAEALALLLAEREARLLTSPIEESERVGLDPTEYPCVSCQWRTDCLGELPEPTPADVLSPEQRERAEKAALDYLTATAAAKEADTAKKEARAALAGVVGTVGAATVSWRTNKDRVRLDQEEARRLLASAELPVPEETVAGARVLTVRRTP